ncbi:hypothetical protein ACFOW1_11460 [Parasediminibacterium paludis]|uniref:pyridoxal kinase n=1 Tax=Parasediminibacterium paludis TaxID=908966 RepID=A0ABV8PWL9_9BACT
MNKKLHVLAISSFAVHGTASLKVFTAILGEKILPVPSKILNGLTNMSLVTTFDPPFKDLLSSSLALAKARELQLIVYIGYLGKPENADIILKLLDEYAFLIQYIIVDPVSGDNNRLYVEESIVAAWPSLIKKADFTFPNQTELQIYGGGDNDAVSFREKFPQTQLIAKSVLSDNDEIGIQYFGNSYFDYFLPRLSKNFGGTGDVLLAHFILYYFYNTYSIEQALKTALDQTHAIIARTILENSTDLLIS